MPSSTGWSIHSAFLSISVNGGGSNGSIKSPNVNGASLAGLASAACSPAAEESLASSLCFVALPASGGRCSDEQPVIANDTTANNQHDVNVRSFIITQSITGPFDASIRRKVTLPNDLREVNDNPMRAASGTAAG